MIRYEELAARIVIALPVLFIFLLIFHDHKVLNWSIDGAAPALDFRNCSHSTKVPDHSLLDGLLAPDFGEECCLSRYQSVSYRKSSPYKPSSYLVAKLRSYEELHKRCGPYTDSYDRAIKQLKSGQIDKSSECKYVVWVAIDGLGNRILSITSGFLYALLTNRVLLINQQAEMADLFCEPFPNATWIVSGDFPMKNQLKSFKQKHARNYGKLLKDIISAPMESLKSYLYLHLPRDQLFFCDENQTLLRKIPWLVMKSDLYFLPSLFLMSSFEQELSKLFPDKETVFHHLGRYLFHPANQVWEIITSYYKQYLAEADEMIGIQIRVYDQRTSPFQKVMDQILTCTQKAKLLPEVDMTATVASPLKNRTTKVVLITSLFTEYFEKMKDMYRRHPTLNGEVIAVHQPSHEKYQYTRDNLHNKKAWAEIYLLSLSNVLVTSAQSTFGYVAQGLRGVKPWILYKIQDQNVPDPPCGRAMSMEPCFHASQVYDCKRKSAVYPATMVPFLRQCEDISWGIKLYNISQ